MHDGIIDCVAIEHGGIRRKDLPVEFGAEHGALEVLRMVVPISHQDELPVRGLDESQDPCQDLGIGGALDCFVGFEVNGPPP